MHIPLRQPAPGLNPATAMRFDWTDLQLFVHACDAGSLTAAAARSHMTLAAASARLRGMEAQAGATLLARHSRGVRPTAAGEALARHARAVLVQLTQLQGELARHAPQGRGRVRLLCNTSALLSWLPPALAGFLQAHPRVDVQVDESPSHLSVQALRQGAADLGIVSSAAETAGLATAALQGDPLLLVAPRGHALLRARRVAFAQVLGHDMVGLGSTSALQAHLGLYAAREGQTMRLRAGLASPDGVCQLVARGVGVAVMPRGLLARQLPDRRLGVRPLTDAWARRTLLLCSAQALDGAAPAGLLHGALHAAGGATGA